MSDAFEKEGFAVGLTNDRFRDADIVAFKCYVGDPCPEMDTADWNASIVADRKRREAKCTEETKQPQGWYCSFADLWRDGNWIVGMGNVVSRYWHERARALFRGQTFYVEPCELEKRGEMWIYQLPFAARDSDHRLYGDVRAAAVADTVEPFFPAMHEGSWSRILPIIQEDSQTAMRRYWEFVAKRDGKTVAEVDPVQVSALRSLIDPHPHCQTRQPPNQLHAQAVGLKQGDAVIHFRCGDVLRNRARDYGFITFDW
jgi:hypothetical protein